MASKVEGGSGTPERAEIGRVIDTDISARLDRLPWGRFHVLVIVALGITWVLDGLEVTLAGSLVGALRKPVGQFAHPGVEVVSRAAIRGRERADHAVDAGGGDEIDARYQKHRRRDQRQGQARTQRPEPVHG